MPNGRKGAGRQATRKIASEAPDGGMRDRPGGLVLGDGRGVEGMNHEVKVVVMNNSPAVCIQDVVVVV
jgi:hypothetical protein